MIGPVSLDYVRVPVDFAGVQHPTPVNCLQVDFGLIQDFDLFSHKKLEFSYVTLFQSVAHTEQPAPGASDS